jgi:hypothetical protein
MGIKWTMPEVSQFTSTGLFLVDFDQQYKKELSRIKNPFKAMYNEYKHKGSWFKIFMMYDKLILMVIFIIQVDASSNKTGYTI